MHVPVAFRTNRPIGMRRLVNREMKEIRSKYHFSTNLMSSSGKNFNRRKNPNRLNDATKGAKIDSC